MALEGLTLEQIAQLESTLLEHVPETDTVGNKALSSELGWPDEALYWEIRNRLIDRGTLIQGRGRGGSVRRTGTAIETISTTQEAAPTDVHSTNDKLSYRELDLYQPMAQVIKDRWAKEHQLDSLLVEVTALQGARQTNGKWSRPDITAASYNTYPYVPGRHFDVITFEIKPYNMLDITVVYEALGHRRASTRAYALLHVPEEEEPSLESIVDDICQEAKRHGIGVITARKPDDFETWEEKVGALRQEPDPQRMNQFLAVQTSQGFREQIIKWFK